MLEDCWEQDAVRIFFIFCFVQDVWSAELNQGLRSKKLLGYGDMKLKYSRIQTFRNPLLVTKGNRVVYRVVLGWNLIFIELETKCLSGSLTFAWHMYVSTRKTKQKIFKLFESKNVYTLREYQSNIEPFMRTKPELSLFMSDLPLKSDTLT